MTTNNDDGKKTQRDEQTNKKTKQKKIKQTSERCGNESKQKENKKEA